MGQRKVSNIIPPKDIPGAKSPQQGIPNIMTSTLHDLNSPINQSNIPPLMLRKSSKKILHKMPESSPTKKLRMKSFLWVFPNKERSPSATCNSSILPQLIPTLIVNLAALSGGLSLGFSAISLPQLRAEMSPDSFEVDEQVGSWIASIFGLGAIFGGLVSAYLGSHFGRRKSLFVMAVPDVIGWFLIAGSNGVHMILLGRFLNGLSAAGYSTSIQIYVAEIAQPHHRGWLSGITIPTLAVGSLFAYIMGMFMEWRYIAAVGGFIPLVLLPGLLWLSDSPYWYLQNNQEKKALQVIDRFRPKENNSMAELLCISDSLNLNVTEFTIKESITRFTRRQYRKPFILLNILFLLMTFSGNHGISFYALDILKTSHDALDEHISIVLIGIIKLLGCLLYIPAVKCFSRKSLLYSTSLVMSMSLAIMGTSIYYNHFQWIPIVSVVIYMLADPIGLGSIPYLYTAEFYPSEMRSVLSGLTIGLNNLELFLAVKTFPDLSNALGGIHGSLWLYSGVCLLALLFIAVFIPETKGSTLQDIENYFGRKESLSVSPLQSPMNTPGQSKRGLAPYPELSLQFTL
eukprot:TRINITY_DN137_c0_g1_i1.p1 TRINITY_DN137_c0_g1~~TRINITY_DN137_c0_g1_i1.p1  ORF type:complete len:572 (+),score=146.85 TRINITY_DN137_c0_g1_i1:311-2026(+)